MTGTRRYAWIAFWIISAHYLIGNFHRVCPAVVAPELISAFGISGASLGILASTYFFAYGAMQIPVGILADAWGVKRTVTLFGCLAALGGIAFGLAPSFGWATAARVLVGVGGSAFFVCAMKLFANWFRGNQYARISGLFLAFGGVGWLFATTPLAFVAESLGWRAVFLVVGGIGLFLTIFTWFRLVERPPDERAAPVESSAGDPPPRPALRGSFLRVVRTWRFWVMAVWIFCINGISFGFQGLWAGPYLMDAYGLSKPAAGTVLSMVAFSMILGAPFLGFLSDRVFESRKKVLMGGAVTLLLSWAVLLAFHGNLPYVALCAVFFFMGLTSSAIGTIGITAAKELFPNDIAGTAIGTLNVFPFIGGIVFQLAAGMILDRSGSAPYPPDAYIPVLWIFFAVSGGSFLSSMLVKETHGREGR
jgi:MFS family permease